MTIANADDLRDGAARIAMDPELEPFIASFPRPT